MPVVSYPSCQWQWAMDKWSIMLGPKEDVGWPHTLRWRCQPRPRQLLCGRTRQDMLSQRSNPHWITPSICGLSSASKFTDHSAELAWRQTGKCQDTAARRLLCYCASLDVCRCPSVQSRLIFPVQTGERMRTMSLIRMLEHHLRWMHLKETTKIQQIIQRGKGYHNLMVLIGLETCARLPSAKDGPRLPRI